MAAAWAAERKGKAAAGSLVGRVEELQVVGIGQNKRRMNCTAPHCVAGHGAMTNGDALHRQSTLK